MSDETKSESVYERARMGLYGLNLGAGNDAWVVLMHTALTAGEAAEKRAEAAEAKVRILEAEVERLRPFEPKIRTLHVEDGEISAAIHGKQMVMILCEAWAGWFKETGATNYLEVKVIHDTIGEIVCTIQKSSGLTPHQFRLEAEKRAESAEAKCGELAIQNSRGHQLLKEAQEKVLHMTNTIGAAILLLNPARPEDGLLPAIRDVMQRLALAEAGRSDDA